MFPPPSRRENKAILLQWDPENGTYNDLGQVQNSNPEGLLLQIIYRKIVNASVVLSMVSKLGMLNGLMI